jgi:hypothetical protein
VISQPLNSEFLMMHVFAGPRSGSLTMKEHGIGCAGMNAGCFGSMDQVSHPPAYFYVHS